MFFLENYRIFMKKIIFFWISTWKNEKVWQIIRSNLFKMHWRALIAQSVEQMTLNHWVEGSSPSGRTIFKIKRWIFMVIVAQLVRAPGCGPGGRGFESLHSPHFFAQIGAKNMKHLLSQIWSISTSFRYDEKIKNESWGNRFASSFIPFCPKTLFLQVIIPLLFQYAKIPLNALI